MTDLQEQEILQFVRATYGLDVVSARALDCGNIGSYTGDEAEVSGFYQGYGDAPVDQTTWRNVFSEFLNSISQIHTS